MRTRIHSEEQAEGMLVRCIRNQEVEDFTLASPVLFLYRHSVEMLLKSRLGAPPNTHDLASLLAAYAEQMRAAHACELPEWVIARVGELAWVDPRSTAFRYAQTYNSTMRCYVAVDGELHVYLDHLQAVVTALHSALNDAPLFRHNCSAEGFPGR